MDLRVLMQTDLVSVLPHLPAVKAVEVMEEWGFRHFPVVDENNLLVGVVSHVDLLRNRGHLASLTIFDVMTARLWSWSHLTAWPRQRGSWLLTRSAASR